MNRRNAILTLTSAMATTAVVALPRLASAQTSSTTTKTLEHPQYKLDTLRLGSLSKQTSMLAAANASTPRIRQFAQFEIAEQTTIAQVLTETNNPPLAPLDAEHAAILKRLQVLSGKQFEITYVRDQLNTHLQLFNAQQEFLNTNPSTADYLHSAMLARTVIQMHITMLQDLQSQLAA